MKWEKWIAEYFINDLINCLFTVGIDFREIKVNKNYINEKSDRNDGDKYYSDIIINNDIDISNIGTKAADMTLLTD